MLSPIQKRYLVVYFLIPSLLINIAINLFFGWLVFPSGQVPLWGEPSVAGDTLVSTFLTALIMGLIMTFFINRDVRAGRIHHIARASQPAVLRWWPHGNVASSLTLAVLFSLTIGPATVLLTHLFGPQTYSWTAAVTYKTVYAGAVGLAMAPLLVVLALREQRFN
jgi:hypothetical protein